MTTWDEDGRKIQRTIDLNEMVEKLVNERWEIERTARWKIEQQRQKLTKLNYFMLLKRFAVYIVIPVVAFYASILLANSFDQSLKWCIYNKMACFKTFTDFAPFSAYPQPAQLVKFNEPTDEDFNRYAALTNSKMEYSLALFQASSRLPTPMAIQLAASKASVLSVRILNSDMDLKQEIALLYDCLSPQLIKVGRNVQAIHTKSLALVRTAHEGFASIIGQIGTSDVKIEKSFENLMDALKTGLDSLNEVTTKAEGNVETAYSLRHGLEVEMTKQRRTMDEMDTSTSATLSLLFRWSLLPAREYNSLKRDLRLFEESQGYLEQTSDALVELRTHLFALEDNIMENRKTLAHYEGFNTAQKVAMMQAKLKAIENFRDKYESMYD